MAVVSAGQRAYAHVKELVLSGALPEGAMISEGQIAEQLGLSRTPVREAFVQLEVQGLLRLYPKRGALVVPVSREEIEQVVETRWVLERHGLERAVDAADAAVIAGMRDLVGQQRDLLAAGDLAAFVDADREFHRVAVAATGNAILLGLYDTIRERQRRMVRRTVEDAQRAQSVLDEHDALVAALAAGGRDALLARLRAHLDRTRRALLGA